MTRLARCLREKGEAEAAEALYVEILALDPSNVIASNFLRGLRLKRERVIADAAEAAATAKRVAAAMKKADNAAKREAAATKKADNAARRESAAARSTADAAPAAGTDAEPALRD
jgi:hypothetical protein